MNSNVRGTGDEAATDVPKKPLSFSSFRHFFISHLIFIPVPCSCTRVPPKEEDSSVIHLTLGPILP